MSAEYRIHVSSDADTAVLEFSGDFSLSNPISEDVSRGRAGKHDVRTTDAGITSWDSSLLTWLLKLKGACEAANQELDITGLPDGIQSMIRLATAVPERKGAARQATQESLPERVGKATMAAWVEAVGMVSFLGEIVASVGRLLTGRARFRRSDFWLTIQQCGPAALGIVTIISVLVGAILAFVGAIQLKMFGAEVYVANLVGIGMVMEMGSLMTGIILAGRTGAAFAAQLGTMQVNEEIDALQTLGIHPIDYLVLPRMLALVLMTPILVIYADVLGILGGAAVGIFALDLPPALFFNQTIAMMTPWHFAQGLIKGSTFGVLVAIAGCLRGIQCGRSASAVGDAATSAVVTSLLMIVIADAIWTIVFMTIG